MCNSADLHDSRTVQVVSNSIHDINFQSVVIPDSHVSANILTSDMHQNEESPDKDIRHIVLQDSCTANHVKSNVVFICSDESVPSSFNTFSSFVDQLTNHPPPPPPTLIFRRRK